MSRRCSMVVSNARLIVYELRAIILLFRFKMTLNVRHLQAARRSNYLPLLPICPFLLLIPFGT
jgi:hypothetical protein